VAARPTGFFIRLENIQGWLYKAGMTTVKEIERAVEHLPPNDLNQFRNWFEAFESASWDRQFEADARNGRLGLLVNEARAEYKTGKTSSL
jgi:hypothetical protein